MPFGVRMPQGGDARRSRLRASLGFVERADLSLLMPFVLVVFACLLVSFCFSPLSLFLRDLVNRMAAG